MGMGLSRTASERMLCPAGLFGARRRKKALWGKHLLPSQVFSAYPLRRFGAVSTLSNSVPIETTFVYDGLSRLKEQLWWTNSAGGGSGGGGSPPPSGGGGGGWTLVGGIAYIYDGNRVIQERDLNNNPLVSYTRGNDLSGSLEGAGGIGGLLARSDGYSSGNFSDHNFYHADGNGNITYLVNSSQTLAASYRYDPFGNLISSSGSLAVSNTYRFSSKEFIPSVGLYCYLYRFYDPGLQRWLNRDPIAERGGMNLYAFVANRPSNGIDRFGLCWEIALLDAQQQIDWALEQLTGQTTESYPWEAEVPTIPVGSQAGQFLNTVYNDALQEEQGLLNIASGGAGLAAQAAAIGNSSVTYVFSAAGVETFGAGAVATAGGAVVLTAAAGYGVGYLAGSSISWGGESLSDHLGNLFYNLFY
jgi:RHS repeat-associated protein